MVDQSTMGQRVTLGCERFEAPGPDGRMQPAFRPATSTGPLSSSDLRTFSSATRQLGESVSDEMSAAGFPSTLLGSAGQDPWASTDPRVMMGTSADFLSGAADAQDAQRAVGADNFDGHAVQHLRADGLARRVTGDDGSVMTVDTIDLWIDDRECMPRKLAMKGSVTSGGETRPVVIERSDGDYRAVAGSKMCEPFRQVLSIKGTPTAEQERELRESQVKMREMEQQLAQMPPAQRQMVEHQMGPQMQMMKRMAAGGGIEVTTQVHSILVNPDTAAVQALQAAAIGSRAPAAGTGPAGTGSSPDAAPQDDLGARRACLEEKARQRREAQREQQGMGRLLGAVGRAASRLGGDAFTRAVSDAQLGKATADDLASAARDLGLTEEEIAECQNAG